MRWSQGDLETDNHSLDAGRENGCTKETHTEKTDEAFGGLQEGEGVDALIGDGDVGEGLGRRGRQVRLGEQKGCSRFEGDENAR
jgi:hypothetical protein